MLPARSRQSVLFVWRGRRSEVEAKMGYSFADPALLTRALTHSSYANEHHQPKHENNERLEFLGDAVLEVVTSEWLFLHFPKAPEGEMTRWRAALVCEDALAESARALSLGSHILLGRGEEAGGGRGKASLLSDCLEAVIGAIFLDGGMESTKTFILTHVLTDPDKRIHQRDSKTSLQEILQKHGRPTPQYVLAGEDGPDHDKRFTVQVLIDGEVMGEGTGRTKKEAEQLAAGIAIERLQEK